MEVNSINSGPDYIHTFVESNIEQLNEIYETGLNDSGEGILFCKCSIQDNKIEIIYMTKELFKASFKNDADTVQNIQTMLKDIRESWEKIPLNMHYMQKVN